MTALTFERIRNRLSPGMLAWLGLIGVCLAIGISLRFECIYQWSGEDEYDRRCPLGFVDHH